MPCATEAPTAAEVLALTDATWPPAAWHRAGPFAVPEGRAGGNRVSAARALGPVGAGDVARAEAAMRDLGQEALFRIGPGDEALDAALAARGHALRDPTVAMWRPCVGLDAPPPVTTFAGWPMIAAQAALWDEAGIGPARRAVMDRAAGPKAALLGRCDDRPAGVGFVAHHGGDAMLHALEVPEAFRRRGMGARLVARAAVWAGQSGADRLVLLVTRANDGARAFYAALGFREGPGYHYRVAP
ncbi:MAG: GNAT family N-acetyltransferase [Paracoccaceae bacterium]